MTASAASKTFLSDRIAFSYVLHILFYVLSQSTCQRECVVRKCQSVVYSLGSFAEKKRMKNNLAFCITIWSSYNK